MLWTIIPAKDPAFAKSRLADVMTPIARRALAEAMALRTLETALAFAQGQPVLLVSASAQLRAMARRLGARTMADGPVPGLNGALAHAAAGVPEGCRLLVLPADLPLLEVADLEAMAAADAGCAIAPDARDEGTNALHGPPLPELFRFGPGSFAAHGRAAAALGLSTVTVRRPGLAFDLDCPADLATLRRHPPSWLAALIGREARCA